MKKTKRKNKRIAEGIVFSLWVISTFLLGLTFKHDSTVELVIGMISLVYFLTCAFLATVANIFHRGEEE